jgi:hypothetical protein
MMLTIGLPARGRRPWHNRSTEHEIPDARRYAKITRHGVAMVTKMPQSVAAQPGFIGQLPTVHGIVNQQIRNVPDDQAACRSAGNLDVPKAREKEKEARKTDDAYPNRVMAPLGLWEPERDHHQTMH